MNTQATFSHTEPLAQTKVVDRQKGNFNRVEVLQRRRYKNIRYANELQQFRNEVEIEDEEVLERLKMFGKSLTTYSSQVVAAVNPNDKFNRLAVKHAHTCNHRLCTVCNSIRAKNLRRKFKKY